MCPLGVSAQFGVHFRSSFSDDRKNGGAGVDNVLAQGNVQTETQRGTTVAFVDIKYNSGMWTNN